MKAFVNISLVAAVIAILFTLVISVAVYNYSGSLPPIVARQRDKLRGSVRSKTVWFNGVLLAALHLAPQWVGYLADQLPGLQPMISNPLFANVLQGVLVVNLLLRFHTHVPLEAK